jgi:arylsulfatase A-like enzyme
VNVSVWLLWVLFACQPEADDKSNKVPRGPGIDVTETTDPDGVSPLVFADGVPKNIVMISIDTLRKDALGFYGGEADTPFLDGLISESVHLDDHMQCSSWTYPSTTCTLMGRSHEANGYMPRLTQLQDPLPMDTEFLAGWLGEAGFVSLISSGNDWLSAKWGNTVGYDIDIHLGGEPGEAVDRLSDLLLAEVESRGAEQWMLHMHMLEPHAPYNPPPAYLEGLEDLPPVPWDLSDRDVHYDLNRDAFDDLPAEQQAALEAHLRFRYLADLAWLDDRLTNLFGVLEDKGLLDDALVVVWTDHGEAFWEHGHQTHAWTLYPEENDAVLFFWAKGLQPKAWTGPTHAFDLVPTLLELHDVPVPESVDGVALGRASDDRLRYASVSARKGPVQLVRQGDDALYYTWRTGQLGLYDLAADPGARVNRLDDEHARAQVLWDAMKPWVVSMDPLLPSDAPLLPVGFD